MAYHVPDKKMNYLDILLIIPLIYGAYKGYKNGLIIEIATLIALALGIYGAIMFSDYMGNLLNEKFDFNEKNMAIISFAVTFILIVISIILLAKLFEKIIHFMFMELANRISGAIFGILKYGIITSFLIILMEYADTKYEFINKDLKSGSLIYSPIASIAPVVMPLVSTNKLFDYLELDKLKIKEQNNL